MTNEDYYQYVPLDLRTSNGRTFYSNAANWTPSIGDYASYDLNHVAPQGVPVDNQTKLHEVLIVDSRLGDGDTDAVKSFYVRAKSREDARVRALLRSHYDEKDIKHLDLIALELVDVKPYVGDGGDDD